MKRLGQIREDYDLITEKVEAESNRLAMLVRAGLFDSKKLPMLKRALSKDVKDMTPAERKILIELLDSLMAEVLQSPQVYNKVKQNVMVKEVEESLESLQESSNKKNFDGYLSKADPRFSKMPTEREIPTIILLKRKAIRVYPDNQKVALYYSQALDKYVTIPFGVIEGGAVNESADDLRTKSDNLTKELPTNTNTSPNTPSNVPPGGKPKTKPKDERKNDPRTKKREDLYTRKLNTQMDMKRARATVRNDDSMDAPTRYGIDAGLKLRQRAMAAAAKRKSPTASPSTDTNISENKGTLAKSKFYAKRNQQIDEALPLALAAGAALRAAGPAIARGLASGAKKAAPIVKNAATGIGRVAANAARATGRGLKRVGAGAAGAAGALAASLGGREAPQERVFSEPKPFTLKATTNKPRSNNIRTSIKPKENKSNTTTNNNNNNNEQNESVLESLYSMRRNEEKEIIIANESILINTITARKIIDVYESLNKNNKEKVDGILNESVESFKKFANFAAKQ
jgi:hypothetical protein